MKFLRDVHISDGHGHLHRSLITQETSHLSALDPDATCRRFSESGSVIHTKLRNLLPNSKKTEYADQDVMDDGRQYLVQYIMQSQAGFFLMLGTMCVEGFVQVVGVRF